MIRDFRDTDINQVIDLLVEFARESEYFDVLGVDYGHLRSLVLTTDVARCLQVAEVDGVVIGVVFGILTSPWFNPWKKIGVEVAWYVKPEHRGSIYGIRLLRIFELWCRENGADVIVVSCLQNLGDGDVLKLLGRCKYRVVEHSAVKVV